MKFLENKTVLVTGASGFIGTHLVKKLSTIAGIRLILISRKKQTSINPAEKWLKGSLNELTTDYWLQHNITEIDVVFHLGAFIPKNNYEANNLDEIFSDNLTGTRALLEGLPETVARIIFASTIDVYSVNEFGDILTETSPLEPSGLYGASKLFCESLVSIWAKKHDCNYAILRYGHVFGPGEDAYNKLIPLAIRQILDGKSPNVYGTGSAERDFIYVDDAVETTIRAANAGRNIGPVNIVRGESSSIRYIVETLIKICESTVSIHYLEEKPDGYSLRFDNTMMQDTLGNWPLVSLADGLVEEVLVTRSLNNE